MVENIQPHAKFSQVYSRASSRFVGHTRASVWANMRAVVVTMADDTFDERAGIPIGENYLNLSQAGSL